MDVMNLLRDKKNSCYSSSMAPMVGFAQSMASSPAIGQSRDLGSPYQCQMRGPMPVAPPASIAYELPLSFSAAQRHCSTTHSCYTINTGAYPPSTAAGVGGVQYPDLVFPPSDSRSWCCVDDPDKHRSALLPH